MIARIGNTRCAKRQTPNAKHETVSGECQAAIAKVEGEGRWSQTANRKPQTANRKPQTANRKPQTANRKPQ
ncbi:hypothetical protein, partial [Burkholderia pseudomallei]|uniref:hypothetical protein n=2 Tax=Burkholderia pseudomallei TaxID=28450 RepID=UPI003984A899